MRGEKKTIDLDSYEEGAVIIALKDLRNKEIEGEKSTDFLDDLMLKIIRAPTRKEKVRDAQR